MKPTKDLRVQDDVQIMLSGSGVLVEKTNLTGSG